MSKIIAVIPARYQSTRFPGKPLALILGKPMIQWVYDTVNKVPSIDETYVATDDKRIFDTVTSFGGASIMTSDKHKCGSDRISECIDILGVDPDTVVLNIQGDEPLIKENMIEKLINCFSEDCVMATLKTKIDDEREVLNPNVVKVITNSRNEAIYFSRSPIPYFRNKTDCNVYKHIGVYGYKADFLKEYSSHPQTILEKTESLEQLRVLEMGYKIKVAETEYETVGVDTPEQLIEVERLLGSMVNHNANCIYT